MQSFLLKHPVAYIYSYQNFNMQTSTQRAGRPSALKTIFAAGIVAGILDISAAFINIILIQQKDTTVQKILQGIASAVFKKKSFDGGWETAMYGLGFHFIIAFCFAAGYYIVYPYIPFLRKQKIIAGLLYGIFVWAVMNIIVLQTVFPAFSPWKNALVNGGILMICIGLPISLITSYFYSKRY